MAKQKGTVKLSGKVDDLNFSSGAYGDRVKKAAKFTQKQKKAAAELPQNKRTGAIGRCASGFKNAVDYYGAGLVKGEFWRRLLSLFKLEKEDHRTLWLQTLKNMEIDETRKFIDVCPLPVIGISFDEKEYTVEVDASKPPKPDRKNPYYFLQFILIVWEKGEDVCRHDEESTAWTDMNDTGRKLLTLRYEKRDTDTDYVLLCRFGVKERLIDRLYPTDTAMRVLAVAPVTEEGQQQMEESAAKKEAAKQAEADAPVVFTKPAVEWRRE